MVLGESLNNKQNNLQGEHTDFSILIEKLKGMLSFTQGRLEGIEPVASLLELSSLSHTMITLRHLNVCAAVSISQIAALYAILLTGRW